MLQTHFQFLDYCDNIDFSLREDGAIRRLSSLAGVAAEDDLVIRAARALQQLSGSPYGIDISVEKTIPTGGGLGGGSSNAATTLVALNVLWQLELTPDELADVGLRLGADVPIFVHGLAAWAEGVGENLTPLNGPNGTVMVIRPPCEVATTAVFSHPQLTRNTPAIKIHDLPRTRVGNDCEPVTCRLHPEVGEALEWMKQFTDARMSGTGACVFGAFANHDAALTAARQLPSKWQYFIAQRRNTSPLLDKLASVR